MNFTFQIYPVYIFWRSAFIWLFAAMSLAAQANSTIPDAVKDTSVDSQLLPTSMNQLPTIYSAMKAWPTSAHELLSNLKLALDNDWLLQPSFYEEQSLREFFGTREKVLNRENTPGLPGFGISSAVYPVLQKYKFTDKQLNAMSYFDRSDVRASGGTGESSVKKRGGHINFYIRESSIKFAEIESIFGKNWKFNPPELPPSPHRIFPTITHPLGSKYMLFDFRTDSLKKTIEIQTHGDGAVKDININIKEK